MRYSILFIILVLAASSAVNAEPAADSLPGAAEIAPQITVSGDAEAAATEAAKLFVKSRFRPTIYDYPYSRSLSLPDWKRLWINTAVLVGAGITTMVVLEALPEESTAWNKRSNEEIPLFKRWKKHVMEGPVWDGDNHIFNYVLHPYAGAAYYMGARSCGFNFLGSFLYSFCISTFFWEYGFESFNEIPSVQDLVITPVVGSLVGEGFYLIKRHIVRNGYRLWGSKVLGYMAAWLVDPLNETIGYFRGDQRKERHRLDSSGGLEASSWVGPSSTGLSAGLTIRYTF